MALKLIVKNFTFISDSKMGEDNNSIDSDSSDSSVEAPSGGQFNQKIDKVLSKTVFDKTRRQSLFRRPSLKAKDDDDEPIPDRRRSQAARRSTVGGPQLADLAELQKRLSQSAPKEESSKKIESVSDGNKRVAVMDTEQKDLEKIMSLQYTINFDVVFATDYTHRTATLSSIDMMKQEIEDQYAKKRLSDLTVAQSEETVEEEQKSVFV